MKQPTIQEEDEMKRDKQDIGLIRAEEHHGVPLHGAWVACALFYILGGLLNGAEIYQKAELMEFGHGRKAAMFLAKPLDILSRRSYLNLPREWIHERWGGKE